MAAKADLVQAAQKEVLDSYRKEFEQLSTSFRDLDGKAQGTAGTAGIFLSAALAFLARQSTDQGVLTKVLLTLAILGLASAIIFCLQALRIRQVAGQPSGKDLEKLLENLARDQDDAVVVERLSYFYGDAARLWEDCILDRRKTIEEKADYVWSAQLSITLTAFAVTAILVKIVLL